MARLSSLYDTREKLQHYDAIHVETVVRFSSTTHSVIVKCISSLSEEI